MPNRFLLALRSAARALRRRPSFTGGAIALMAATLFALTVVLALFQAVVLRPLPFAEPEMLVGVHATVQRQVRERRGFSLVDFRDYQQQLRSVDAIGAYASFSASLTGAGDARALQGEAIDARYLAVLRVAPVLGRALGVDDARASPLLISERLWNDALGRGSDVLGRAVAIDGRPFTISGVMPAGFAGVTGVADVWLPLDAPGWLGDAEAHNRGTRWLEAVARLAPGRTPADLDRELATIGARLESSYRDSNAGYSAESIALREELLGGQGAAVRAVAAGVALLLMITVFNLSGLALVRTSTRALEHAMRRCLGAEPARLFAETASEGAIVGFVAGAIATFAARLSMPRLVGALPIDLPPFVATDVTPGVAALVLAIGSIGGFVAFALGGVVASRARLVTLRAGARATRSHGALRRLLIGGEIALGVTLLAAALMLARSFGAIAALDPGYRVDDTLVMDFDLPAGRYDRARAAAFAERLAQLARETPGVRAAAVATDSPLGSSSNAALVTSDRLEDVTTRVYRHGVGAGFFDATGIALTSGEPFSATLSATDERQAIVSAALARRLWPGADAVGKRLKYGGAVSTAPWMRVVGVAADTRWRGLPEGPTQDPDLFLPLAQAPDLSCALIVHAAGGAASLAPALVEKLRSLDADVAATSTQAMSDRVMRALQIPRFLAVLGLLFAALALLLSTLGIYAIAALEAQQRVRELAIRQAVGAGVPALARLFAGEYARILVAAIALGLLGLVPLGGLIRSQLYGVTPADWQSIGGAVVLFALALTIGIAAPLRRVLAVEPAALMAGE